MRARFRPIVPRRLLTEPEKLMDAVEDALDKAAADIKRDFESTVSSWDTVVRFMILSRKGEREVATNNKIYKWVNDGTKKHVIRPKNAKMLVFMLGGAPKTKPGYVGSGPGRQGAALAFAMKVFHPGTKPRRFNKIIRNQWANKLPKLLQKAINDAV